jgi:hypothetical protein
LPQNFRNSKALRNKTDTNNWHKNTLITKGTTVPVHHHNHNNNNHQPPPILSLVRNFVIISSKENLRTQFMLIILPSTLSAIQASMFTMSSVPHCYKALSVTPL